MSSVIVAVAVAVAAVETRTMPAGLAPRRKSVRISQPLETPKFVRSLTPTRTSALSDNVCESFGVSCCRAWCEN
uniref:Putative secreted protein n=1 Tax=Anopheles triannulatus TaxID=58253 RepID=A0A2M4B7H8_9DIPT